MSSGHGPWREDDPLMPRVMGALVISLLAHVAFFGVVQMGSQLQWWEAKPFKIFRTVKITPEELAKIQEQERRKLEAEEKQLPITFVQVTEPSEEAPEKTPFYSSVSSRAANPEPGNLDRPKFEGTQEKLLRMADAPRVMTGRPTPPPQPEAPGPADAPPKAASTPAPRPETVTPPAEAPKLVEREPVPAKPAGIGELAMVKPEVKPLPPPRPEPEVERPTKPAEESVAPSPAPRSRPRTVTEAKLRQSLLAGEKMRQDGGVARKGVSQLDVRGTGFGAYDEAMIAAVQNRWYTLLDERRFAGGVRGRVVVTFRLHADGSVRGCQAAETEVDALFTSLCVRSVQDPAPYERWPSDMVRMIGDNSREIRFTFFYN